MLELPERGFIEYIPGEFAWRAIETKGWMVIHCLWVVGKSKGRASAAASSECVKDAKKSGMRGVAMVTSQGNWLAGQKLLESHGFKAVDTARRRSRSWSKPSSPALCRHSPMIWRTGRPVSVKA